MHKAKLFSYYEIKMTHWYKHLDRQITRYLFFNQVSFILPHIKIFSKSFKGHFTTYFYFENTYTYFKIFYTINLGTGEKAQGIKFLSCTWVILDWCQNHMWRSNHCHEWSLTTVPEEVSSEHHYLWYHTPPILKSLIKNRLTNYLKFSY